MGFLTLVELSGRKAAENDVGSDEIDKDEPSLFRAFTVALAVSSSKSELSAVEVVIGKVVATKVVKESDTLRSGKKSKWRGLLVDVAEYLLCTAKLTAMEKELKAEIRCQVNSYPPSIRLSITIHARGVTTSLTKALLEGFSNHIS